GRTTSSTKSRQLCRIMRCSSDRPRSDDIRSSIAFPRWCIVIVQCYADIRPSRGRPTNGRNRLFRRDESWQSRGWGIEMSERQNNVMDGGCTCGAIRYRLKAKPLFVHCCHCTWCQRKSGSAFAVNAFIEASQVELLKGNPERTTLPSASGR